ncbi:MAG: hypothetical protein VR67_00245 [Peptococcaceae bacterium BRH_c8a]|nr:MAG: hypothetical protein VR67_00245 [Peptococcaceae bacterium BRH_c8a]
MPCIKIENLTHTYFPGTPLETAALQDISLTVDQGETLALAGATGSGKSTLVRHLNGLLAPTAGRVRILDGDVADKKFRRQLWRRVGLVFQFPERQIFSATVHEDIAFGPRNTGLAGQALSERVSQAAAAVGLPEDMLRTDPAELSGGMLRRAAIAGVLAMHPDILILDEPGAGLEPRARESILQRIKELQVSQGTTVILITHQLDDAALYADRLALLKKGRLLAVGPTAEILSRCDLLDEAGLEPPFTVELTRRLAAAGINLPKTPLNPAEAARLLAVML